MIYIDKLYLSKMCFGRSEFRPLRVGPGAKFAPRLVQSGFDFSSMDPLSTNFFSFILSLYRYIFFYMFFSKKNHDSFILTG